jgi:hypothetical protein
VSEHVLSAALAVLGALFAYGPGLVGEDSDGTRAALRLFGLTAARSGRSNRIGEIVLVAARGDILVPSNRSIRAHTRHSASGVEKTEAERALQLFVLLRRLNLGSNPSVFPNSSVAAWNVGPYFLLTDLNKYCPRVIPGVGPDGERRADR